MCGFFTLGALAMLSPAGIAWCGVGGDQADDVAGEVGGGGLRGRERIGAARDMHVDIGGWAVQDGGLRGRERIGAARDRHVGERHGLA